MASVLARGSSSKPNTRIGKVILPAADAHPTPGRHRNIQASRSSVPTEASPEPVNLHPARDVWLAYTKEPAKCAQ